MQSLFDNIIALEKEADQHIDKARAEAQEIKTAAEEELRRYRDMLAFEREQRLQDKEKKASEQFQQAVAEEEQRSKKALQAIENITKDKIHLQVEHILSRFRER